MNISIVIPVFNDTSNLKTLIQNIKVICKKEAFTCEIILVDDNPSPQTRHELILIKKEISCFAIRIVFLTSNQGQQRATLCGLLYAKGDTIITMDADGQHPPSEIPKLVNALITHQYDLVYGTASAGHPKYLQWFSFCYKWLLHQLGNPIDRHANSFRCFTSSLIHKAINNLPPVILNIDAILIKASEHSAVINTLHHPRPNNKSSYTLKSRLSLAARNFIVNKSFFSLIKTLGFFLAVTALFIMLTNKGSQYTAVLLLFVTGLLTLGIIPVVRQYNKRRYPSLKSCIREIVE